MFAPPHQVRVICARALEKRYDGGDPLAILCRRLRHSDNVAALKVRSGWRWGSWSC